MADRRRKEDAEATPAADRRRTGPRRSAPRMPVSLWAVEDDGSGIYYHHVSDLSPGGLFLEKGLTLPIGSRMQLELTLPTARSIRAEGVVVTNVQNKTAGNGIRFDKISDADKKAIDDYISASGR